MIRLDDRQQRFAYLGAIVAALGFVAAHVTDLPDSAGFIAIGLAMAAVLAFGAYRRSVVLTGAGAFLVSFGPWDWLWFLGAPFIALGGLLMFRASKQAAQAKPEREPKPQPQAAAPQPKEKKPPPPSKRYTPPTTRSKRSGGT